MTDNEKDENKEGESHEEFEEEFNFESEGEHEGEEDNLPPAPAEEAKPTLEPPKRKSSTFPAIIGLAILSFIGWKVYQFFQPKPPGPETAEIQAVPEKAIAKAPEAPKTLPQSAIPSWQEATKNLPSEAKPLTTEEMIAQLQKKLDEQERTSKQQIQLLEKDLANVVQFTATSNKGISDLQQQVASLSTVVQNLTAQLGTMEHKHKERPFKKPKKIKKAHKEHKAESNPGLTVYAIIPGRAWLRSSNGKTITVAEGDAIGEYGKVLKIDAGNGVVITTSGATLR